MLECLLPLACLVFQDPAPATDAQGLVPRGRAFGMVKTTTGEPWVGAEVWIASRPGGSDPRLQPLDLIKVRTDDRGGYRAQVIRGWVYSVWACGPENDGAYRATGVIEGVCAGYPAVLKEQEDSLHRHTVVVNGLDPWRDDGPFRYRASSGTANVCTAAGDIEGGRFDLPLLPGSRATVQVLDRRGFVLVARASVSLSKGGEAEVSVPPPRVIRVRMYDDEFKNRVKGGAVFAVHDELRTKIGELDGDGRAELRLPLAEAASFDAWGYRVVAPGHSAGFMEVVATPTDGDEAGKKWIADGGLLLEGGLAEGKAVAGRVMIAGEPAADVAVLIAGEAHGAVTPSHYYGADHRLLTRTGADGRFVARGVWPQGGAVFRVALTPPLLARLPAEWRAGLHPVGLLATFDDKTGPDIGVLDLARDFWVADLVVQTADGLPAERALLRIHGPQGEQAHELRLDHLGRGRTLLPRKGLIEITTTGAGSYFAERFRIRAPKPVAKAQRWTLRMRESFPLKILVVDADGKSVPKASISVHPDWSSTPERTGPPPEKVALGEVTLEPVLPEGGRAPDGIAMRLVRRAIVSGGTTDGDGRVTLMLPGYRMVLRLNGSVRAGDQWEQIPPAKLEVVGEAEEYELRWGGRVDGGEGKE